MPMSKNVASKSNSDERGEVRVLGVTLLCRRPVDDESLRKADLNGIDGRSDVGRDVRGIDVDRCAALQLEHVYGVPGGQSGTKTGC